jgi:hypothetical protein
MVVLMIYVKKRTIHYQAYAYASSIICAYALFVETACLFMEYVAPIIFINILYCCYICFVFVLFCFTLFLFVCCFILFYVLLLYFVLCCFMLFYVVLCCFVLFCFAFFVFVFCFLLFCFVVLPFAWFYFVCWSENHDYLLHLYRDVFTNSPIGTIVVSICICELFFCC